MSRETKRLEFNARLKEILGSDNVYFQPPASIHMAYPCFVYSYESSDNFHADDMKYLTNYRYALTYITKDPLPDEIMAILDAMPYTRLTRHYEADNLHHFSYDVHLLERAQNG